MNVLMLGWELPPYNSGGLGEACMGLTKALANQNVDITFVLPVKVDVKADHMNVMFANIEDHLSVVHPAYTTIASLKTSQTLGSFPTDYVQGALAFAEAIERLSKKVKADIIHSHDWMTFPAGIVAQSVLSKPLVTHIHSTENDRTGGNYPNKAVYDIEKDGVTRSNKVITVSNFTKESVMREYAVEGSKVHVVHNGVEDFRKPELPRVLSVYKNAGYKIVLFLGRITLQKGPEYFVKTAKKISEYDEKVLFVVVGTGDMEQQMIEEASQAGILHKFIFAGFLRGIEKDRMYQSADVYVMPSVSEPFGITTLEAVANNTCVLASKQSGVSEVLTHILKSDFWDIDEMANKILALLRYPALSHDLRKESKKELPNINWNNAAQKTLQIYNKLV